MLIKWRFILMLRNFLDSWTNGRKPVRACFIAFDYGCAWTGWSERFPAFRLCGLHSHNYQFHHYVVLIGTKPCAKYDIIFQYTQYQHSILRTVTEQSSFQSKTAIIFPKFNNYLLNLNRSINYRFTRYSQEVLHKRNTCLIWFSFRLNFNIFIIKIWGFL